MDLKTVRTYLRRGGRERYRRSSPVGEALGQEHGEFLRRRAVEVDWNAQVLFREIRERGYGGSYEVLKRWVPGKSE